MPLGPPQEINYEAHLTLPEGMYPQVPARSEKKNDFAEYEAHYALKGSVFEGSRLLRISVDRIAADKISVYRDLYKIIDDDQRRWIPLIETSAASGPHSSNPDAQKLLDEGYQSLQFGAPHAAVQSLQEAVKLDSSVADAWLLLGRAQIMNHQADAGLISIRKAIAMDPTSISARRQLAETLENHDKKADAIEAWRDLLKIQPDDRDAASKLAILLVTTGKEGEAVPLLEKLVAAAPDSTLCIQLAQTYLDTKQPEKAQVQIRKAVELSHDAPTLNTAAYIMAEANVDLPGALKYIQQAVQQTETATSTSSAPRYDLMSELAGEWDTIGWIYFKMNQLADAERYLSAAWKLLQAETIGDHLGQVYEKGGQRKSALHMYGLTLATIPPGGNPTLRDKLIAKLKNNDAAAPKWSDSMDELQNLRTFHMKPVVPGERSADFVVLITKGPKVEEVRFLNGAQELNDAGTKLTGLKFQAEFPDDGPTRLAYRGLLNCSTSRGDCMFVLEPPMPEGPPAPATN